ncbi:aldolase [Pseudactinotalea sp. HY160]|nr:aldolase/citrate lyase family protein [Pseudactinotalea sp. HY160]MPV50343.1 aldolase [Pseudactinotalea sp. HY160]
MSAVTTVNERIEALLAPVDAAAARNYPGDDGSRQPIHSVYLPGDRYRPSTPREWGEAALEAVAEIGGMTELMRIHGLVDDADEAARIAAKVEAKLRTEPIEDLRLDFEDGFGDRGDEAEDEAVRAGARFVAQAASEGTAPPFIGIRFKCFEPRTRARGLRSLELFVDELAPRGLPENLVLTLPMVTDVAQIEAMVLMLSELERRHGLREGRLTFEIQVETPQAILGVDGTSPLPRMIAAGGGRITGMPYGTYDYSASVGIAAAYQSMEHPAADYAKEVMQAAAAGTGVRLSDGSTNILPVGAGARAAWALHGRLVTRSLERGFYQGWDLHPAQLPSRYAATYAFFRRSLSDANRRLAVYLGEGTGSVMDEPATARALAWFLRRGLDCGSIDEGELAVPVTALAELMAP